MSEGGRADFKKKKKKQLDFHTKKKNFKEKRLQYSNGSFTASGALSLTYWHHHTREVE